MKCGVISDKKLLISIIRRFDMDSDARLSKEEFISWAIRVVEHSRKK